MDSATATLITIFKERVEQLLAEGNLDEALHAANAMLEQAQKLLSPDIEDICCYVDALELRGRVQQEMQRNEDALDDFLEALEQLQNCESCHDQIGRLHAEAGAVSDALGRTDEAIHHGFEAIRSFECCDPPLLLDIAVLSNNLGYLIKATGDYAQAEECYLRALEINHQQLGQRHVQTAAVASNLGALYHATGYVEQARQMHEIALEVRRELLGEAHPDTAQSHNNLALALLETGDRSWARRHFEKALSGYESLGSAHHADLETVVINYTEFLRQNSENQLAATILSRFQNATSRQS